MGVWLGWCRETALAVACGVGQWPGDADGWACIVDVGRWSSVRAGALPGCNCSLTLSADGLLTVAGCCVPTAVAAGRGARRVSSGAQALRRRQSYGKAPKRANFARFGSSGIRAEACGCATVRAPRRARAVKSAVNSLTRSDSRYIARYYSSSSSAYIYTIFNDIIGLAGLGRRPATTPGRGASCRAVGGAASAASAGAPALGMAGRGFDRGFVRVAVRGDAPGPDCTARAGLRADAHARRSAGEG